MRICHLREKEVINVCDCKRLGYVADLDFDPDSGCLCALIVPGPCQILGCLGRDSEYIIPFPCVRQIGKDIILVEIDPGKCLTRCKY
ncbi:MAG: YlmC/YmxH family sporulation protein [Lachnospiraceae bacterium]|nr:YlmC/YmxH family sporulation protein [Lachnospiraceae bacterium]